MRQAEPDSVEIGFIRIGIEEYKRRDAAKYSAHLKCQNILKCQMPNVKCQNILFLLKVNGRHAYETRPSFMKPDSRVLT